MKKTLYTLFIIFVMKNNLAAQTIILESNFDVFEQFYIEPVIFSSIQNVYISGFIESTVSIAVTPNPNYSILIKAPNPVSSVTNPSSPLLGGSKGTILRSKPGVTGGGKAETIKSENDVILYQIYDDLIIVSNDNIIGYDIYDILGNVILSEKITPTNNYIIDASELKKAIYIVKVDLVDQEYKTIKFIKN